MASDWEFLFNRGLQGETLVREWLKMQGLFVLPTSLIATGGAPALASHLKKVVASDILVSGLGRTYWAEVKTYQRSTWNNKRHREEHGIPIRLWQAYLEGERITGIPGYLYILQLYEGDGRTPLNRILEGSLKIIQIGAAEMTEQYPPSGPQIFFDVRRFNWYDGDTLEPVLVNCPIPDPLPPKTLRSWEIQRRWAKYRQLPLGDPPPGEAVKS